MKMTTIRLLACTLPLAILAACSSTQPDTNDLNGRVESIRPNSGVPESFSLLVTDATFSNSKGLSSPIYIVVGPTTKIYLASRTAPASEISVGNYIHAVLDDIVLDSDPQIVGASRIDITGPIVTSRSN